MRVNRFGDCSEALTKLSDCEYLIACVENDKLRSILNLSQDWKDDQDRNETNEKNV